MRIRDKSLDMYYVDPLLTTADVLSIDERAMKDLLMEKYDKQGKSLLVEIQKWRVDHPHATFREAICILFSQER